MWSELSQDRNTLSPQQWKTVRQLLLTPCFSKYFLAADWWRRSLHMVAWYPSTQIRTAVCPKRFLCRPGHAWCGSGDSRPARCNPNFWVGCAGASAALAGQRRHLTNWSDCGPRVASSQRTSEQSNRVGARGVSIDGACSIYAVLYLCVMLTMHSPDQHRTILILCRDADPTRNKPSGWIRLSSQICSGLLGNCPKAPCRKASGAGARTRTWSQALYPVHSTAWVTPPRRWACWTPASSYRSFLGVQLQPRTPSISRSLLVSLITSSMSSKFHVKLDRGGNLQSYCPCLIFPAECEVYLGWEFKVLWLVYILLIPYIDVP